MKHNNTNEIYLYWNKIRGTQTVPDRTDIEPSEIRHILKDTFILEQNAVDAYSFRLAGTRICSIFGREMKNRDFLDLTQDETREAVQTVLHSTVEDKSVNVLGFVGKSESGRSMAFEVILLPLSLKHSDEVRLFGTISPLKIPYWVGLQPVQKLELSSFRMILPHQHTRELGRMMNRRQNETVFDLVRSRHQPSVQTNNQAAQEAHESGRRVGHLVVLDGGGNQ